MDRLIVAHITPSLSTVVMGGVQTTLHELVSHSGGMAIDNHILCFEADAYDISRTSPFSTIHCLDAPGDAPPDALQTVTWLTATLAQICPDVVQTNAFWGDTLGRVAARRAGVKTVIALENNMNLLETMRQTKMKRRLANKTDCIVCVSKSVQDYVCETEGIERSRTHVIPNGIDTARYARTLRPPQQPASDPDLIFVGRLEPQKRPLVALEAIRQVVSEFPNTRLVMVGDGGLRDKCETFIQACNLETNVTLAGFQPDPWHSVCQQKTLICSSDFEGLPNTILEAMAIGVLCILPDIPPHLELVAPDQGAIFYSAGDADALAKAIAKSGKLSAKARKEIINTAQRTVNERFSAGRMAQDYVALYRRLTETRNHGDVSPIAPQRARHDR